jgi:hypothetical protein
MSPAFHAPSFSVFFSNLHCCICAVAAAKAAKIPIMAAEDAQKTPSCLWQIRCFFFAHSSPFLLCYCCCCPTIVIHHCPLCYSMVVIHSTGRGDFHFQVQEDLRDLSLSPYGCQLRWQVSKPDQILLTIVRVDGHWRRLLSWLREPWHEEKVSEKALTRRLSQGRLHDTECDDARTMERT